ncbi:MAG: radical SAM protein [Desulfatibacillum sp.]|nr:radical SAM protein [Desulfatibacillum sp.]
MTSQGIRHKQVRCIRPFTSLELQPGGEVSFCCVEWSKVPYIGNVQYQSLAEIWNSDTARYIRRKMYAGEWTDVCRPEVCPVLISEGWKDLTLEGNETRLFTLTERHIEDIGSAKTFMQASPTYVLMSNLETCNLKCPMCGPFREIYAENRLGAPFSCAVDKQREIVEGEDMGALERVAREVHTGLPDLKVLGLTGAGDPLFRKDTRNILFSKRKNSNPKIALFTNGLLFEPKIWKKIKHNAFHYVNVSVDAATRDTYENLRRPGKWDTLTANLEFLSDLRKQGVIPLFFINFTVMRSNLEEMVDFVRLGKHLGVDSIYFQKIRGIIWNRENFFDGPDRDETLLKRLEKLKPEARKESGSSTTVVFGNL